MDKPADACTGLDTQSEADSLALAIRARKLAEEALRVSAATRQVIYGSQQLLDHLAVERRLEARVLATAAETALRKP